MTISPDGIIFWQWGTFALNATIVFTWLVMALLSLISWLVTRRICNHYRAFPLAKSAGSPGYRHSRSNP